MTEKTAHYALTIWEREDEFRSPEGLNENFTALDGALAGKTELVMGSYTGNGVDGRTVELGFTPKSVLICRQDGMMGSTNYYVYGGLLLPGISLQANGYDAAAIVENGFQLYVPDDHIRINVKNYVYIYWAVR